MSTLKNTKGPFAQTLPLLGALALATGAVGGLLACNTDLATNEQGKATTVGSGVGGSGGADVSNAVASTTGNSASGTGGMVAAGGGGGRGGGDAEGGRGGAVVTCQYPGCTTTQEFGCGLSYHANDGAKDYAPFAGGGEQIGALDYDLAGAMSICTANTECTGVAHPWYSEDQGGWYPVKNHMKSQSSYGRLLVKNCN